MKKLYVGCSLAHAPQEFIDEVLELRNSLKKDFEMLEFIGVGEGTLQEVFTHDITCVKKCDVLLAICNLPSTGLGYELGVAVESGKKVLAVAHTDAKVSRLVQGINLPNFTFMRYNDINEVVQKLKKEYKK